MLRSGESRRSVFFREPSAAISSYACRLIYVLGSKKGKLRLAKPSFRSKLWPGGNMLTTAILLLAFMQNAAPQAQPPHATGAQGAPAQSAQPAAGAPAQSGSPSAQMGLYVYPAKNQTAAQQQQDEGECLGWAQSQPASAQANQQAAN